jgi:Spy/CpxP family protein refolding chaperone
MTTSSVSSEAAQSLRRRWLAGLAALGSLGFIGTQAHAHGWGRRGAVDPEERARRLDWRIGRMVKDVGGTAQQKDRLVAIASAAMGDLGPLRDQARQARLRSLDLLAAPVVDKMALEEQRVVQMRASDARSRRTVQAMAEAAEVLTPDQRAKLVARIKQRADRRRGG